jgi:hypothetical protein
MNNCTPMRREPDLEVKGVKPRERRNAFGTGDVGKVRAAVTRTTRGSQNVQNASGSALLEAGTIRSARCCGAKHISNSNCTKRQMFGLLLHVEASLIVAGAMDSASCPK